MFPLGCRKKEEEDDTVDQSVTLIADVSFVHYPLINNGLDVE